MLFPPHIIEVIVSCAFWADGLVRADLIEKVIVSENDYTSNFTSAFRREVNARAIKGLKARIQLLDGSQERSFGADACVIFENNSHSKVGVFEAKWPRLRTHSDCWDSRQKSTGRSHFDSQLERQRQLRPQVAVWEMFYCEFPFGLQPSYMPDHGSACAWHDDAYEFMQTVRGQSDPWQDWELVGLLEMRALTISDVVREMCQCTQGHPIPKGSELKVFGDLPPPRSALVISYDDDGAT